MFSKRNLAALILSLAIFVSTQSSIYAQERGDKVTQLIEKLDLSEEQSLRLVELQQSQKEKTKAIRNNNKLEDKRGALQQLREDHQLDIKAILTAEQQEKYAALKQEHKEARKEKKENRKAARKELKEYRQSEVNPVLKEHRQQLNEQMDAEDITYLAMVQQELMDYKANHKAEKKEAKKAGTKHPKGKKLGAMKAYFNANPDKLKGVEAIATKYNDQIEAIYTDLGNDKAAWGEDMKEIKEKHRPGAEQHDGDSKRSERKKRKRGKKGKKKGQYKHLSFLLMEF